MRALRVGPLLTAVALTACVDGLSPASERTGFISATTVNIGAGPNYAVTFVGAFYRYDGLEVGFEPPETCQAYVYSSLPVPIASFPTIDAGDRLITTISGRQDTLLKTNALGVTSYQLAGTIGSVPLTPGDTLSIVIPGALAGFPAATVRVRTSEPFTFDPVGTAGETQPVPVTWTAAPAPGSVMLFYLRFSSLSTTDEPNTEIRCAFTDDGSGSVPVPFSSAWSAAPPGSRSVVVQRARLSTVSLDSKTRVSLLSFFDRPLPVGTP